MAPRQTTSPHPGSQAAAVLPAAQPTQDVAIRRGRADSPGGALKGTICYSRTPHLWTGGCPASRLPIAPSPWSTGARSRRRAVIRTASFARTLYTICTYTLPCIDPQ